MNVLIVDDHKISRLYLKKSLTDNFTAIKRIDEAATVSESIALIETVDYDIIFLEMELKDGIGFDIIKKVKDFVYVIAVTNHKSYAIEAFKQNIVDYILKPLDNDELVNAVKKVLKLQLKETTRQIKNSEPTNVQGHDEPALDRMMVNYKNEMVAINIKDIVFIKALGKYSEIHVANKKLYMSYKNLKEFELAIPNVLLRVHHSYLVNSSSIISYSRETSHVLLTNSDQIPVSVRKREELFKKFKVF